MGSSGEEFARSVEFDPFLLLVWWAVTMIWEIGRIFLEFYLAACSAYSMFYVWTAIFHPIFHIQNMSLLHYRGRARIMNRPTQTNRLSVGLIMLTIIPGIGNIFYFAAGSLFSFIPMSIRFPSSGDVSFPMQTVLKVFFCIFMTATYLEKLIGPSAFEIRARAEGLARDHIIQWLRELSPNLRQDFVEKLMPTMRTWDPFTLPIVDLVSHEARSILFACCNNIDEVTAARVWNDEYGFHFRKLNPQQEIYTKTPDAEYYLRDSNEEIDTP